MAPGSRSSLQHVGSSSLPSMEPGPPALGCGVFTIGPPGESRSMLFRQTLPYLGVLKWFLILCLYNRSYSESSSQNTVLFISDFILQKKPHKFLRPIFKRKMPPFNSLRNAFHRFKNSSELILWLRFRWELYPLPGSLIQTGHPW